MKNTWLLAFIFLLPIGSLQAWPFFFSGERFPLFARKSTFTVMLDPAGDTKNPGRVIDDTYERSIAMQFAEELKKHLEASSSKLRVVLTRFPGETVEPLQHISFSNRLEVDLYISIHFYEKKAGQSELYIYNLIYDPASDFIEKKTSNLSLLPYDQAYKISLSSTKKYSKLMYDTCSKTARKYYTQCHSPRGVPYKPLIGILAPAIGIEIGIAKKNQWKKLVPLIAQGIEAIVTS